MKGDLELENKSLSNVFFYLAVLIYTLFTWSIYFDNGTATLLLPIVFFILLVIVIIMYGIVLDGFAFKKEKYKNKTVYTITRIIFIITIFSNVILSRKTWILLSWFIFTILLLIEKKQTE